MLRYVIFREYLGLQNAGDVAGDVKRTARGLPDDYFKEDEFCPMHHFHDVA